MKGVLLGMQETNDLLSETLSNLQGIIIFSLDTQYRYTAFTSSHAEIMKTLWGVDIAIGENMLEYIRHPDDRKKAKENFDRVLNGETLILEEEYGDRVAHTRSWWEDRYTPIYDSVHNIMGLTVFVIDITQRKQIEQALQTSEINYHFIMEQAADGIFIASKDGRYLDVNRAGCDLLGYTREEILGMSMKDLIHGDTIEIKFKELFEGKSIISERELISKSGKPIPVEISSRMMEDGRLMGIVRNVTPRRREEARTRFMAFVMNNISSAVITTDVNARIIHWNKSAESLYGWSEEEVLGRQVDEVCRTEFLDGQQEIAQQTILVEKNWRGELKQRHRNGGEIWVDASYTLLEDRNGKNIGGVTINHDVTERKLAEDELRRTKESIEQINLTLRRAFEREQLASRTDSLTGTFNRRYFFELLGYEFAASRRYRRPLSLVMFDVDYLKRINDTYGHQSGDVLLTKTAQVVRNELREPDVLARYGGDEFVILLSNTGEEEAYKVLERIHKRIQATSILVEGKKLGITISAGVATMDPEMEKSERLVMYADRALYTAKKTGRNRIVIYCDADYKENKH